MLSEKTKSRLENLFKSIQTEFDTTDPNSTIYQFNNSPAQTNFTLSEHGKTVFSLSNSIYNLTDGQFNPAIYPLVELWQFLPKFPVSNFNVPDTESIKTAKSSIDFTKVVILENTLKKTDGSLKLDFGGILKGYVSDLASQILIEEGHSAGYINIGSSSISILSCESLGIRHPRSTIDMPLILSLNTSKMKNFCVSSSGDYEKYYVKDGKRYSHLINPLTGYPSQTNVIGVTMLGKNGAVLDALSTTACLYEYYPNDNNSPLIEFFKKVCQNYTDTIVFAIYNDGNNKRLITNETDLKKITLYDTEYEIVKF